MGLMLYLMVVILVGLSVVFAVTIFMAILSALIERFGIFGYCLVIAIYTFGPIFLIAILL